MNERDKQRLQDMLNEAQRACKFLHAKTRTDLAEDDLLAYGVVRAVEIVGEAAYQTSDETRKEYPQIPWQNIIGMRHHLIHGYGSVDLDIVWEIVDHNLPDLIAKLEPILAPSQKADL